MHTENLTILFVDIADFTATTNRQSRRQNARLLENFVKLLKPAIQQLQGQLVKSIGDALLISFRSPTNAMLCACQMQDRLHWYQQQHPHEEPIVIRIAAHLGEVRLARHDIFGEAVNLAARIEEQTPAGEIYLSEAVFLAMNKTEVSVESAGQFQLAGFDHQMHLYKVCQAANAKLPFGSDPLTFKANLWSKPALWTGVVAVILSIMIVVVWQWQPRKIATLPVQVNAAPPAQYVRIVWPAVDHATFSPELQYALRQAIEAGIMQEGNFYPADANTTAKAIHQLQVHIKTAIYPKPAEVTLQFKHDTARLQLNWQLNDSATWLAQSQQFVHARLFQRPFEARMAPATKLAAAQFNKVLQARWLYQQANSQMQQQLYRELQQLLLADSSLVSASSEATILLCDSALDILLLGEPLSSVQVAYAYCAALPDNSNEAAMLALGRYQQREGQTERAEQLFLRAIQQMPKDAKAYSLLANLYQQQGKPLEAERVYQLAVRLQPNHWYPLQSLAVFQLEQGRHQEAIRLFNQVVKLLPGNVNALTNLGSAYLLQGQIQAAADTYQSALQLSPEVNTQANLATVYYYLGRLDDAIELYQAALRQAPNRFELLGNLADALRHKGQLDAAQQSYQQALNILAQKQVLSARELALKAHYGAWTAEPAVADWLQKARSEAPDNAEVWLISAQQYAREQQTELALDAASKALQLGFPAKLLAVDPDLAMLANEHRFLSMLQPKGV